MNRERKEEVLRVTVWENLTHREADSLHWKDEAPSKSFPAYADMMTCLISCSIERECRSSALMFIVTFLSPADIKAFITVCKCTAACKVIFCGSYFPVIIWPLKWVHSFATQVHFCVPYFKKWLYISSKNVQNDFFQREML